MFNIGSLGYGHYVDEPSDLNIDEVSELELDQIDCCGVLKIPLIITTIFATGILAFAREAAKFISCPDFLANLWTTTPKKPNIRSRGATHKSAANRYGCRWTKHLEELARIGMLTPTESAKAIASYFAVPKGCPKNVKPKARAIFNGKRLSSMMKAPPPINLPSPPEILLHLLLLDNRKKFSILTADWRHFFHQIKLHKDNSDWFCIRLGRKILRWVTLPMGLSWSPYVAQSISWAMIIKMYEECKEWPFALSREALLRQPPSFLHFANGDGFITIYLDNLIVVGTPAVMKFFTSRKKVLADCNLCIKEWTEISDVLWETVPAVFLGMEVWRIRTARGTYWLRWRQSAEKVEKWKDAFINTLWKDSGEKNADGTPLLNKNFKISYRMMMRLCSRILWRQALSLLPLCDFADIINIMRQRSKDKHRGRHNWDSSFEMSAEEHEILCHHFHDININKPFEQECQDIKKIRKQIFCCSDASSKGWGYVVYKDGEAVANESGIGSGVWTREQNYHIFVLEFLAAKKTIEHILSGNVSEEQLEIVIGIDNTAVAHVLRNRYTANTFIQNDLAELMMKIRDANCILRVVNLRSADNVADDPSRGRRASNENQARTHQILCHEQLIDSIKGIRNNPYNRAHAPGYDERMSRLVGDETEYEDPLDELTEQLSQEENAM